MVNNLATIKLIGQEVTEIDSKGNTFGDSPVLSVDNSAGKLSVIDSTDDAFTGTKPFISLSGDGSAVTIKVSNLKKDNTVVTTNADVIAASSNAKVFWKDSKAYGVDTVDALNAFIAANDETAVRLNADFSATKAQAVTVPSGNTVTIDLNGHTLGSTGADAISNNGKLTIKGIGKVTTSAKSSAAVVNMPDGVVDLNGGDYTSGSWYVIKNLGQMTINGNVNVLGTDGNVSSLIDNGWYSDTDTVSGQKISAQSGKANLHIISGEFDGKSGDKSCSVLKNDDYGVCVIDGGILDSTNNAGSGVEGKENATTVLNWNDLTINGGTFKGLYNVSNGSAGAESADKGVLVINGGDFTPDIANNHIVFGAAGGATVGEGLVTINGGTFNGDVTFPTGTPYKNIINGGTFANDVSDSATGCVLGKGKSVTQSGNKYIVA